MAGARSGAIPPIAAQSTERAWWTVLAPQLLGQKAEKPSRIFNALERTLRISDLQTGEPGPLAQAAAGVDIALCNLVARRAGAPVRKLFDAEAANTIAAYASGIHPTRSKTLSLRHARAATVSTS